MHFSLNRNYLYEDLKDFNLFLEKFSFVRFFNGMFETSPHPKSLKYCERLIKGIGWRTSESQEFLLVLLRMQSWERFVIGVNDYVAAYQQLYE